MVESHYRIVYGIALRTIGDERRAEDVTMSVFTALRTSGRLGEPETTGAWLLLNARRESIAVLRESTEPTHEALQAALLEDGFLGGPSDRKPWRRGTASDALEALSLEERSIFELGYFEGLSYHQIASRTGLDPAVVKTRIRSGLDKLVSNDVEPGR